MLGIQNRRFMGNKYKLLDFIEEVINQNCPNAKSIFDVFSGTGVVGYHFMSKMRVIANDMLYSSYLVNIAFMAKEKVDIVKIQKIIGEYNSLNVELLQSNYMDKTFANTYFSELDCKKIGYVRENIEQRYKKQEINDRERAILISALLLSMDKIANTVGHYDAYRKNVAFRGSLQIEMLDLSAKPHFQNKFYNKDCNKLVLEKDFPFVDVVYCDPPYNSRNYCDTYHVLENVAKWDKPEVFGDARKMDRKNLKSRYCSGSSAANAFEDLVDNLQCKCIILSYNNTEKKANVTGCVMNDFCVKLST